MRGIQNDRARIHAHAHSQAEEKMMGFKIAITGIVVFVFCSFMAHVARSEPKQPVMFAFFGWLILGGLASIPVGLIIQIWQ